MLSFVKIYIYKKKKKIEDTNVKFEYSDLIHVDYG